MSQVPASRRARGVWWLSPAGALLMIVPVPLWQAVQLNDAHYRTTWRTPKWITTETALLFACGALTLIASSLIAVHLAERGGRSESVLPSQVPGLQRIERLLFRITVTGYVLLLGLGVARGIRPAQVLHAVTSQDAYGRTLKDAFAPIAGVTSLTQVGIAQVVVGGLLLSRQWDRQTARRVGVVLLLALLRAFFLTERLAIIELLVPLAAVVAMKTTASRRPGRSLAVQWAPLVLIPALIGVFGAFEYSRSWVYFSKHSQDSFAQFMVSRLDGYYITSYNNGELLLDDSAKEAVPYRSVEAMWTAPGLAQAHLYERLASDDPTLDFNQDLTKRASLEFNSPGGLAVPFADLGRLGGFAFFVVAGLGLGWCYSLFRQGSVWGLLLFPLLSTGVFELPRYVYWTQGRVVPSLLALVVTGVAVKRSETAP